ncbi:MAG TPA: hypothetical protein VFO34_06480 [Candidatus Acidoferrales bacterium]|nr:hypothetical protein [Candidatus Acidoferrales bacterium]
MSKFTSLRWACAKCRARFESADALRKHGKRIHKVGLEARRGGISPLANGADVSESEVTGIPAAARASAGGR